MRYNRVREILQADNALKRRLSKNMSAVCRPDQTHDEFPVEVVYVTEEIHKQGLDASTLAKGEVIRTAHRLLVANPVPDLLAVLTPQLAPEAPAPEAKLPKAKVPKEKPKAKAKVPKAEAPKAKPKVPKAEAPKVPKAPKEKPKAKPKVLVPKVSATADTSPAAVEPKSTGGTQESSVATLPPKAPPAFIRPYIAHVPGIAMMNCLYGARQLMEPFSASDPDAKDICHKLDDLIDELHRRTVLPSAEKESTTG